MASEIIDFEEERSRHGQIFGRADVLAKLCDFLTGDRTRGLGWVLLLGPPGVGKSAIVNRLLDMLPRETPYHFVRRGSKGWDRPSMVVHNLCARLEQHFPEATNRDLAVEARLGDLLQRVSRNHLVPQDRRLIVVIDGLDELVVDGASASPPLGFIPDPPPRGVVILCSSRPMYPHLDSRFQRGKRCIDLDQPDWRRSNEGSVRAFWEYHAYQFNPPLDAVFIEKAVCAASGNLLHATLLRDWLDEQPVEQRPEADIPAEITGFLSHTWNAFHQLGSGRCEIVLKGLGLACAAREAVPDYVFGELLGGSTIDSEAFLQMARPFLRAERAQWLEGKIGYRPYHDCFREFIEEKLGPRKVGEYHRQIADTLAAWPPEEGDPARLAYALRHAVTHRLEASDTIGAFRICTDVAYLEAKCRELGVPALERDFDAVLRVLGQEAALDLSTILGAVRAEANQLHAHPGSLPALLYNRLLCDGWSHTRIRRSLRFEAGPPPLRLLHGVRLGPARLRCFPPQNKPVVACAPTPDGLHILTASTDRSLRLLDLLSGECIAVLDGHADELTACAITSDGRLAISASTDSTAKLWDLATRRCVGTLDNDERWATSCTVTRDGNHLVVGSDNGVIGIWDLSSQQRLSTLSGHDDYITACLTTSSAKIVSASRDGSVRVWDLETTECNHVLEAEARLPTARATPEHRWINAIVVLHGGTQILAAAGDGSMAHWDIETGRCIRVFGAGQGRVDAMALLHDDQYVLCGMADGSVAIWDVVQAVRVLVFRAHEGAVSVLTNMAGGRRILTASQDSTIALWELGRPQYLSSREAHRGPVTACAMTPDGRTAVSASGDKSLKVWDVDTGTCRATLEGHTDVVAACAISADGQRVLSAGQDGEVWLWHLESGRRESVASDGRPVSGCAILPDGALLTASHSPSGALLLREAGDPARLAEVGVTGCATNGLAVSPDGAIAMTLSSARIAYVWAIRARKALRLLNITAPPIGGVLSPDSRTAVLARADGKLEILDIHTRKPPDVLTGEVTACAVSPEGKRLLTISEDGTLRVLDLETRKCIATLHGTGRFRCITAASDRICIGDEDGSLWMIADDTGLRTPRGWSSVPPGRVHLTPDEMAKLRDALARLYNEPGTVLLFARDLGIDETRLNRNGSIREVWDAILVEASKQRRIEAVLRRALHDYESDHVLIELSHEG